MPLELDRRRVLPTLLSFHFFWPVFSAEPIRSARTCCNRPVQLSAVHNTLRRLRRHKSRTPTLDTEEFIRRFLLQKPSNTATEPPANPWPAIISAIVPRLPDHHAIQIP